MKYPQEQYVILKENVKRIWEAAGDACKAYQRDIPQVRALHNLYFAAFVLGSYPPIHGANVINHTLGHVIFSKEEDILEGGKFEQYPVGIHDSHIETAMRKISKELDLKLRDF